MLWDSAHWSHSSDSQGLASCLAQDGDGDGDEGGD